MLLLLKGGLSFVNLSRSFLLSYDRWLGSTLMIISCLKYSQELVSGSINSHFILVTPDFGISF